VRQAEFMTETCLFFKEKHMTLTFTFLNTYSLFDFLDFISVFKGVQTGETRHLGREQDYYFEEADLAKVLLKGSVIAKMRKRFAVVSVIEA
jgi:hypothetical protein